MTPTELQVAAIRDRHRYVEGFNPDGIEVHGCVCGDRNCDALVLIEYADYLIDAIKKIARVTA